MAGEQHRQPRCDLVRYMVIPVARCREEPEVSDHQVTKLRDKIFWYVLKIALAGGAIYLIIHYGGNIIRRILP